MSVTVKILILPKQAEVTQTAQYTADGVKAIIDKFTATNTSAVDVTLNVNLIKDSGSAGVDNLILKDRVIAPNEVYTCPELIGQVLEDGGFISTIASIATSLTISAAGREIT